VTCRPAARLKRPGAAALAGALVAACTVGSHELLGKPCPCLAEYVCDPSTNRCVRPTSVSDATTGLDAQLSDAGGTGDFCASYPGAPICDDFHALPTIPPWTSVAAANGGSLSMTSLPEEFRSPPSALSTIAPMVDASPAAAAYVEKELRGDVTDLVCRFSVNLVNAMMAESYAEVGIFRVETAGTIDSSVIQETVEWRLHANGGRIVESFFLREGGSGLDELGPPVGVQVARWTEVQLSLHFGDTGGTLAVLLDRQPAIQTAIRSPYPNGSLRVRLGINEPRAGDWRVLFDDFACTTS
jgi:hypothetical protein